MSVQFDEERQLPKRKKQKAGGFAALVIKTGIVKTEGAANVVLLVLGIILLAIAFLVYSANDASGTDLKPVPNDSWPKAQG